MPPPELTADGRYVVVDGRRWRASDPAIPQTLRAELVAELMAARRAVRAGGDVDAARMRVGDAKVALGERGRAWWDPWDADAARERIGAAIRALLRSRDPAATICPSEAARIACGVAWRVGGMVATRSVADDLARLGEVSIRQGGRTVDATARGPIRLARGPEFPCPT